MAVMTKKLIRDSFIRLLNEKPFSKITVRDIVDDCGVNRNTFYYYYQDLPQLLESIVDEEADRLIREVKEQVFTTTEAPEALLTAEKEGQQ